MQTKSMSERIAYNKEIIQKANKHGSVGVTFSDLRARANDSVLVIEELRNELDVTVKNAIKFVQNDGMIADNLRLMAENEALRAKIKELEEKLKEAEEAIILEHRKNHEQFKEIKELEGKVLEWLPIQSAPLTGRMVLVFYKNCFGNGRIVKARYIAKNSEATTGDYCDNCEYNEELDEYFVPEGWYEQIDNWGDFSEIAIGEGKITHWMELPKYPEETQITEKSDD